MTSGTVYFTNTGSVTNDVVDGNPAEIKVNKI